MLGDDVRLQVSDEMLEAGAAAIRAVANTNVVGEVAAFEFAERAIRAAFAIVTQSESTLYRTTAEIPHP